MATPHSSVSSSNPGTVTSNEYLTPTVTLGPDGDAKEKLIMGTYSPCLPPSYPTNLPRPAGVLDCPPVIPRNVPTGESTDVSPAPGPAQRASRGYAGEDYFPLTMPTAMLIVVSFAIISSIVVRTTKRLLGHDLRKGQRTKFQRHEDTDKATLRAHDEKGELEPLLGAEARSSETKPMRD